MRTTSKILLVLKIFNGREHCSISIARSDWVGFMIRSISMMKFQIFQFFLRRLIHKKVEVHQNLYQNERIKLDQSI